MHGRPAPDRDALAGLLAADGGTTLDRLLRSCWPAGGERTDRTGRTWLALWGPLRVRAAPPDFGCSRAHCATCN
jgi:hypothetical protein